MNRELVFFVVLGCYVDVHLLSPERRAPEIDADKRRASSRSTCKWLVHIETPLRAVCAIKKWPMFP